MNVLRRNLELQLKKRNWLRTVHGQTIQGPDRLFKTIIEEIIWALNESGTPLTVDEIAQYLAFNKKSVSKAISKFRKHRLANKVIIQYKPGKYGAKLPKGMDIPTFVKMVKTLT